MNSKVKKTKNVKDNKKSEPASFLTMEYYKLQIENLSNELKK